MSKVYLKAEVTIIVDTDLSDVNEIADRLNVNVTSNDRDSVEVYENEFETLKIVDAK